MDPLVVTLTSYLW